MKKLLWCAAIVGVFCVITVVVLSLNPDNQILAVSKTSSAGYEEMVVLKRNHTYEQLLRRQSDGTVVTHSGKWALSKDDVNSRLFAAQTGTRLSGDYITYKDKISADREFGVLSQSDSSLEPSIGMHDPDEKMLATLKEWRAVAKPFSATD